MTQEATKNNFSFLNIFNFKGRINRRQFFILFLIFFPLIILSIKHYHLFILFVILFIPSNIKRFHDMDIALWVPVIFLGSFILWPFSVIFFAFTIGLIMNTLMATFFYFFLIALYFLMQLTVSGTKGENKYGPQPTPQLTQGISISKKHFFIGAIILTLIFFALTFVVNFKMNKLDLQKKQAIEKYEKQDYTGATNDFNKILEKHPKNNISYFYLGRINHDQKKYKESLENFNKALNFTDSSNKELTAKIYSHRAITQIMLDNRQEAQNDCNNAIKTYSKSPEVYRNCVTVEKLLLHNIFALDYQNKLIEIEPHNAYNYIHRGETYLDLHEYRKAIEDFNDAISVSASLPEMYIAYYKRGLAKYKLNGFREAIKDFDFCLNTHPFSEAYKARGDANYKLGNYAEAISDYSKAIQIHPDTFRFYHNRAVAYKKLGDLDNAAKDLAKAKELLGSAYYTKTDPDLL